MDKQNQIVEIREQFTLLVPGDYQVSSGSGDDTQFVQIYTEDGRIVMGYETGVENWKSFKSLDHLKDNYQVIENIENINEINVWWAYYPTETKLRNIKGEVFIKQDQQLRELLNFSCNSADLQKIRQVFRTIKKK
jgi:hypothetical protein